MNDEIASEIFALMTLGKERVRNWFPLTLAVTGSFALLVGLFVAVLSIPEVVAAGHPGSKLPMQGALYVGTNTCFTCHGDHSLNWSTTVYKQTVVNPSEKPQVVSNLPREQVQQIDSSDMVDAYTTTDTVSSTDSLVHQHYVIKTEDGHLLLPNLPTTDDLEAEGTLSICNSCHTTSFGVKQRGFEIIDSLTRLDTHLLLNIERVANTV